MAQTQTHRSLEQTREPRNKPKHIISWSTTKEEIIYNEEKAVSSVNCTGKTGKLHIKNKAK